MEVDADVHVVAARLAQRRERRARFVDELLRGNHAGLRAVLYARLERGEALILASLELFRIVADMRVDADAIARRTTEQFIHGHTHELTFDVPERLFDAAQRAGEDRTAAIERVTIDRLPVMHDVARIFADEIRRDLRNRFGASLGAPFGNRFAPADDAFVGVDLEEEPARFHEHRLQLGDPQLGLEARGISIAVSLATGVRHRHRRLFGGARPGGSRGEAGARHKLLDEAAPRSGGATDGCGETDGWHDLHLSVLG